VLLSNNPLSLTSKNREIPLTETTSSHCKKQLTPFKTSHDTLQQPSLDTETYQLTQRHAILTIREKYHFLTQVPTISNMVNMRPFHSKIQNNLSTNSSNVDIDPTLQISRDIILTKNKTSIHLIRISRIY
jgi:hypothetical protein